MMTRVQYSKYAIIFWCLTLTGCGCNDMNCLCPKFEIHLASKTSDEYNVIRVDLNYNKIEETLLVLTLHSDKYEYDFDEKLFNFHGNQSIEDFNYIFINRRNQQADTISGIYYERKAYKFKCNDCLIGNDYQKCDQIVNAKIHFNGKRISDLNVMLN